MTALLLSFLLIVPPTDPPNRDDCSKLLPVTSRSELPVRSFPEARRVWAGRDNVSTDTLQTYISQLQEARRCLHRLPESVLERPSRVILYTLKWEGYLHAALSRFSRATEAFDEAMNHLDDGAALPPDELEVLRTAERPYLHQERGYLHYLLGNLSDALDQYLKALQHTPNAKVLPRINLLKSIGVLHQRTQDYRAAHYYLSRAQRLYQNNNLSAPLQRAKLLYSKADLLLEQTLNTQFDRTALEQARTLARRSRAIADAGTEQFDHSSMALSESLGYLGKVEEAYRLNAQSLQYARRHEDVRRQAFVLLKRGVLHMQTEKWARAAKPLRRALSLAEDLGDLDLQRRILRAQGRLYELRSDWSTAEEYYRQGVAVIEAYRESLAATQWSSMAFAQWRDVHRGLVRTLLAQNRPREALTALDRSRARHLQDLRTQARVANQLAPAARARLDSVSRVLSDVRTRLGTDTLSTAAETDLRTRETTLIADRQDLLQIDSSVADRPTIETVSARLDEQDRALVSYFLDDPWSVYDRPPRSTAFVLTADTLRTLSLPHLTQDSVRATVTATSSLFAEPRASERPGAMHFDLQPLRQLHDQLYAPVDEHLAPGQPLTVIPDGPLFHVPFSMLVSATPGGRYDHSQARFVLHDRPTTLELATSMTGERPDPAFDPSSSSPDLAVFGVSAFDSLQTVPSALRTTLSAPTPDTPPRLSPLPGVQSETEALRDLIGDVETFLDDDATEPAFAEAGRRAGVIHLASHAFVHPSSPLQNAFLLHPDSTSDGLLFLHELQTRDRPIPLAVLSGCSTAQGTLRGGEGMAGLQYAFRAMGAQATVANLWPTADQSSVALMRSFYQRLQSGLPKDRALREAKLAYLENHPNQASPFFWGPSVLYGSPRPVPLDSSGGLFSWLWSPFGAGLLLALVAGGLWVLPYYEFS